MQRLWFMDVQTMGYMPDAKVLSIAVLCHVVNKPMSIEQLYSEVYEVYLNPKYQADRNYSKNCLGYWGELYKSDKKAQEFLKKTNEGLNLDDAYQEIAKYVNLYGFEKDEIIHSRGMYDKFVWMSMYPDSQMFPIYTWRDTASVLDALTDSVCGGIEGKQGYDSKMNIAMDCKRLLNMIVPF